MRREGCIISRVGCGGEDSEGVHDSPVQRKEGYIYDTSGTIMMPQVQGKEGYSHFTSGKRRELCIHSLS